MHKFIRNISVKARLACFISFLLLLLSFSGITGLKGIHKSNNTLSMVYQHHVIPIDELKSLENLIHTGIIKPVDQLLFENITWEECQQQTDKSKKIIFSGWQNFLNKLHNDQATSVPLETKQLIEEVTSLISQTENVLDTLSLILHSRSTDQLDSYTDASLYLLGETYSEVSPRITKIILQQIEEQYNLSQDLYSRTRTHFILITVFSVILSISLGYLLIKSINTPLAQISMAMDHLTKGDLTKRLNCNSKDEFNTVINGFNQMTDYLAELISEIEKSGIQVGSSITEIAATIKEQEATVSEHAATSNEIAASTTEIAATGTNLLETMGKVANMAENTATAAAEGHHRLTNINEIMAGMDKSAEAIVAKLSVLGEKTTSIAGVTQTIHKIADQTNLLSLNAAIEAEKAGEYGSGFSVVSSEIRRLADQTAVATYDIEQMAEEVRSAINSGMISIENFAEDVKKSVAEIQISSKYIIQVIDKVQTLESPIASLQDGISAQSLGAEQISESINHLNEAAQQTAESMTQTSNTIFQLNKAAAILRDSVERFTLSS